MKRHFPIKLGQLNQEESGSYHFLTLYLIPYISAEKYGNEPESQKWNGKFRSDRVFGDRPRSSYAGAPVYCSMASGVRESFFLSLSLFLFPPIKQMLYDGHFSHLAFNFTRFW